MRPFSTRENASRQKCTFASASWKALIAIAFNLARLKTSNIIGPSYKMYALGRDSIEDDLMNREMRLPAMNELQVFQVQYFNSDCRLWEILIKLKLFSTLFVSKRVRIHVFQFYSRTCLSLSVLLHYKNSKFEFVAYNL